MVEKVIVLSCNKASEIARRCWLKFKEIMEQECHLKNTENKKTYHKSSKKKRMNRTKRTINNLMSICAKQILRYQPSFYSISPNHQGIKYFWQFPLTKPPFSREWGFSASTLCDYLPNIVNLAVIITEKIALIKIDPTL